MANIIKAEILAHRRGRQRGCSSMPKCCSIVSICQARKDRSRTEEERLLLFTNIDSPKCCEAMKLKE